MTDQTLTKPRVPPSPPGLRALRRRRAAGESGAALVEFAVVIGLFVSVLYGLIAFGMMLALKQSVTSAAAEAARAAVGITTDGAAITTAQTTAADRLDWLSPAQQAALIITPTILNPCPNGSGRCIRVEITYPYAGNELIPPAPGLGLVTPSSFGSTAVVKITD